MALNVPLQAVPSQTFSVLLGGQSCTLNVYQKFYGLFMDVFVNINSAQTTIITSVLCLNNNYIVRSLYLGFSGDFVFTDLQPDPILGPSDPSYTGLGTRFVLTYLATTDLPSTYGLSS